MDIIDIRFALRTFLSEGVVSQAFATLVITPGQNPRLETRIQIIGYDRSASREKGGYGPEEDPERGSFKWSGLPERTRTGRALPSPWILFMDWLWEFLRQNNLTPTPVTGFGDISQRYGKLSVSGKRQRKYGTETRGEYDVKKDLDMAIEPIGMTQDEVAKKFNELLKAADIPDWFYIIPDSRGNYFHAIANIEDVQDVEGWEKRAEDIATYRRENREKWKNAIKKLTDGRTNPAQLAPLVVAYLIERGGFKRPFHIDVMTQEEFNNTLQTVGRLNLEEIVKFAVETKRIPPLITKKAKPKGTESALVLWNREIRRLADEGGSEPYVIQVALSDYMTQKGFEEPFEPELLTFQQLARAVTIARKLTWETIAPFTESVKRTITRITGTGW